MHWSSEPAARLKGSPVFGRLRELHGRIERLPIPAAAWIFGLLAQENGRIVLVFVPHEAQARSFLQG
ncbi:MAG: hypothetical protein OEM62_07680, partial [Acidobacteriota bacterium]|nr:hypothetical protein [Acidobacteriota bacterium]